MPAGRNPKFSEPSRPVTVTLPLSVLQQLEKVHLDRGKAIVKCVAMAAATSLKDKPVEIVKISDSSGMIVIGPCRCLETIPWLRLVEISPNRFLISILPETSVTELEVAILDLIEHDLASDDEKPLLEELRQYISRHRRKEAVTKREILLIDL
jgi:hypothetical protein